MPLMEAFEQNHRYVFVPERAKKPLFSAVALMNDGRVALELTAAPAALKTKTKALEKILGKPRQSLMLPETGMLRLLYAKGCEAVLSKLCKAGHLTRDDMEHALMQFERLELKSAQAGKGPAGLVAQDNARVSA
ncbi:MAG: hypothetical protein HY053_02085 [Proteobacteria bacterium]|nr:hypothetical protein [Pseudomonadota bacterium]